jgi:alpha-D-ribose 1-methylphosphonate 5-triphosphate diphosphatase PhnM
MLLLLLVLFSLVDAAINIRVLVVWFVLGMSGLVHMVQQRTLCSHHEDSHYCVKNYKNLRHYAISLKQKLVEAGSDAGVAFISSDDKSKVCVAFKLRDPVNVC